MILAIAGGVLVVWNELLATRTRRVGIGYVVTTFIGFVLIGCALLQGLFL